MELVFVLLYSKQIIAGECYEHMTEGLPLGKRPQKAENLLIASGRETRHIYGAF